MNYQDKVNLRTDIQTGSAQDRFKTRVIRISKSTIRRNLTAAKKDKNNNKQTNPSQPAVFSSLSSSSFLPFFHITPSKQNMSSLSPDTLFYTLALQ